MNFSLPSVPSAKDLSAVADATLAFNRAVLNATLDQFTAQHQTNLALVEAMQPAKGRKLDVQASLTTYASQSWANLATAVAKFNGQFTKLYTECQPLLTPEA